MDVDGTGGPLKPFNGQCNQIGMHVIGHEWNLRAKDIECTSDCSSPKHVPVTYFWPNEIMVALKRKFRYCTQRADMNNCLNVSTVSPSGASTSYWSSYDGVPMRFWPGGKKSGGCSCARRNSCSPPGNDNNIHDLYSANSSKLLISTFMSRSLASIKL